MLIVLYIQTLLDIYSDNWIQLALIHIRTIFSNGVDGYENPKYKYIIQIRIGLFVFVFIPITILYCPDPTSLSTWVSPCCQNCGLGN